MQHKDVPKDQLRSGHFFQDPRGQILNMHLLMSILLCYDGMCLRFYVNNFLFNFMYILCLKITAEVGQGQGK